MPLLLFIRSSSIDHRSCFMRFTNQKNKAHILLYFFGTAYLRCLCASPGNYETIDGAFYFCLDKNESFPNTFKFLIFFFEKVFLLNSVFGKLNIKQKDFIV